MLMLLFTGTLKAETTWIPISNGGNFIIIPFIPNYKYSQPNNVTLVKLSNGVTITWNDIQHASKYRVEGLDSNGNWVLLREVDSNSVTFSPLPNGISRLRVSGCTYNSCTNSGGWSEISADSYSNLSTKKYFYDALGRLITVENLGKSKSMYEYDDADNRKSKTTIKQ